MNTENRKKETTPQKTQGPQDEGIKVDGLQQVIEMLKTADPAFRDSLLRRIQAKDPKLAQSLMRKIS